MRQLIVNKPEVAKWKARHKKTDDDIAKALRVPYSSWCRWLGGKTPIPAGALMELAELMEMDPRDLVEVRQEPAPRPRRDRQAEQALRSVLAPGPQVRSEATA